MDLLWNRHLLSPREPGIVKAADASVLVLVRKKDIDESSRLFGEDIRCSCVRRLDDVDGTSVLEIVRMLPMRGTSPSLAGT